MGASTAAPTRRAFRGLKPEERQEQRRQKLIEAGLEVFGSRGFHGVRVRDICVAAHLTERYFYESFTNREALFVAVYEQAVLRIREAVLAAVRETLPDAAATARSSLRAFLTTLQDEPRLARIVLIDVLTVGHDVAEQSRLMTQSFADLVRDLVLQLHPEVDDLGLDPQLVANGLVGSTVYLAMRWAFDGFREPLERILEHCALFYDAVEEHTQRKSPLANVTRAPHLAAARTPSNPENAP